MRPNGIGKKPPTYTDPCVPWLMKLSKAALADCVVDMLRGMSECCDDPIAVERAIERIEPVLVLRGDSIPPTARGAR
jgi:hypothetical protein